LREEGVEPAHVRFFRHECLRLRRAIISPCGTVQITAISHNPVRDSMERVRRGANPQAPGRCLYRWVQQPTGIPTHACVLPASPRHEALGHRPDDTIAGVVRRRAAPRHQDGLWTSPRRRMLLCCARRQYGFLGIGIPALGPPRAADKVYTPTQQSNIVALLWPDSHRQVHLTMALFIQPTRALSESFHSHRCTSIYRLSRSTFIPAVTGYSPIRATPAARVRASRLVTQAHSLCRTAEQYQERRAGYISLQPNPDWERSVCPARPLTWPAHCSADVPFAARVLFHAAAIRFVRYSLVPSPGRQTLQDQDVPLSGRAKCCQYSILRSAMLITARDKEVESLSMAIIASGRVLCFVITW